MSILGIGNDLVDIRRIEHLLERFGNRFITRIFTPSERLVAENQTYPYFKSRAAYYAKRFAAKEAFVKALGTGFSNGIQWRDISVTNRPTGQPTLLLQGKTLTKLQHITPPNMIPQTYLSLTDEYPFAQAFVLISANTIPQQ